MSDYDKMTDAEFSQARCKFTEFMKARGYDCYPVGITFKEAVGECLEVLEENARLKKRVAELEGELEAQQYDRMETQALREAMLDDE